MHQRPTTRRIGSALLLCTVAVVAAAGLAPPVGAATDANRTYVRALYVDLLDRPDPTVNSAGVEFWANRLDTQSRSQVAMGIQKASMEYYGRVVDIAYLAYLDREADAAGRAFYVDAWRTRTRTLEAVVVALVGSNEYFTLHGGTNESFVEAAYFDILGREPSTAEAAAGIALVTSSSRGALARRLETSTERRRQVVTNGYGTFLGRIPSAGERDYWVGRLEDGLRREFFDVALVASSEYYNANS